jgi:hypothetical protein
MKFIKSKKGFVLLATLAVAVAAAVGAYAYWTTGGTGTGSATAGSTTDVSVYQTSTPSGTLYPGGPADALSGDFTNPNPNTVHLASVTAAVTGVTGAGTDSSKPDCTTADFVIGGSTGPIVVPAHAAGHVGSWSGLTIKLADGAANQDNCKGASAVITYTANPAS